MTPDRQLALFPLPLVLFPRCVVPLHIFEPRYRAMLADCLSSDGEFGLIAQAPGSDERLIAAGTVGCIAHIEHAQQLPDGRSNILISGRGRVEIVAMVDHPAPYLVASVREVNDVGEGSAPLEPLASHVAALFRRVADAARSLQDVPAPPPELPQDPAVLSFAIGHVLDLSMEQKLRLLASRSPADRLGQLEDILTRMVDDIERRATVHHEAKQNGHGPVASLGT